MRMIGTRWSLAVYAAWTGLATTLSANIYLTYEVLDRTCADYSLSLGVAGGILVLVGALWQEPMFGLVALWFLVALLVRLTGDESDLPVTWCVSHVRHVDVALIPICLCASLAALASMYQRVARDRRDAARVAGLQTGPKRASLVGNMSLSN
ncbi:hypothetical protein KIPB_005176 [Kipferlia bialata]|uniref:Uncharacterized protein n=1 Tax=Kipferlia bialata TaxID=797122 RepID=A0A9K3GHZ4_9EUKA|nr:hypothetical protein KIPB_005176 [Kipferlia bialata]|eukprot:g5176.t1